MKTSCYKHVVRTFSDLSRKVNSEKLLGWQFSNVFLAPDSCESGSIIGIPWTGERGVIVMTGFTKKNLITAVTVAALAFGATAISAIDASATNITNNGNGNGNGNIGSNNGNNNGNVSAINYNASKSNTGNVSYNGNGNGNGNAGSSNGNNNGNVSSINYNTSKCNCIIGNGNNNGNANAGSNNGSNNGNVSSINFGFSNGNLVGNN